MFMALALFIQVLLDAIVVVLNGICSLFPPSPFQFAINSAFGDFIGKINYFIPIYEFVAIGEAWLVAIGIFYGISIVARWVKAVA